MAEENKDPQVEDQQEPVDNKPPADDGTTVYTAKDIQSAASKAKYDIMKSLGVTSIDEFKKQQEVLNEFQKSQLTEQEKIQQELTELKESNIEYKASIQRNEHYKEALKQGASATTADDVVKLAGITGDMKPEEAIKAIIEKYPHFKQVKKVDVQIGGQRGNDNHQNDKNKKFNFERF